MTTTEFNEKYKNHLGERHYGMSIHNEDVINYLDGEFEKEIIENPEFEFYQIKTKFNFPCVYSTSNKNKEWEEKIKKILDL